MDKSSVKITIESLHEIRNHPDARHQIIMICNREIERLERIAAAAPDLLEACYGILNIEGPAIQGGKLGAFEGLDVPYHFSKIRAAIAKAEGR